MSRLLVVEDEQHLAEGLRFNLEADGYDVDLVGTGEAALDRLLRPDHGFDAVILDIMLPGVDGFSVAARVRAQNDHVPILMLTARGRAEDVLKGFDSGADDYLPKPFDLQILLARVRGLLRRLAWARGGKAAKDAEPPSEVFRFNGKIVDFSALEVQGRSRTYRLTQMEADLLRHLIKNAGRVVSRKQILEEVWGLHVDTDTRAIDNFIVRLRRYIEDDPTHPKHLLTVRGIGYRFVAEENKT